MQDISQPLSAADVLENVTRFYSKKTNGVLIGLIVMQCFLAIIVYAALLSGMDKVGAEALVYGFSIMFGILGLILLIAAFVKSRKEKHPEKHLVFQRYGGAEGVAATFNEAYGRVEYADKRFMLTPTFIMKPGDFTTFIPNKCLLLVCKEDRRGQAAMAMLLGALLASAIYSNKPTGLFLTAYNCYGDHIDYQFTGKPAQVDYIVNLVQPFAPQCAIGDSPQTRAYLAQNIRKPV
ncbi:MAG: hypothetical protein IJ060_12125 [Oscillospiraceae bacterium]|nr:hypothetical protein [Oscillospiraceae bacterium]